MALTDFTKALGTQQGRTQPREFTPAGEWSFVLGHERPGDVSFFQIGDEVKNGASGLFIPAVGPRINIVRYRGQVRSPSTLPPGVGWQVAIVVDSVVRASRILGTGGTKRQVVDMAANVSDLGAGAHTLEFVLKVVAV